MKPFKYKYDWTTKDEWFLPDDEEMMQAQFTIMDEQVEIVTDAIAAAGKDIPPNTCIQAGGAFGLYPLALSRYFKQVITFEPVLENLQCMAANIGNHPSIKVVEHPLWHTPNVPLTMTYSKRVKNSYGAHHVALPHEVRGHSPVMTKTIDAMLLLDVDLIWLDIEGSELSAIKGADLTIKMCRPVIVLEDRHLPQMRKMGVSPGQARRYVCEMHNYKEWGRTHSDTILVPNE